MASCPQCSSTFVRSARPRGLRRLLNRIRRQRTVACWHCNYRWQVSGKEPVVNGGSESADARKDGAAARERFTDVGGDERFAGSRATGPPGARQRPAVS